LLRYNLFGLSFASEEPFPELLPSTSPEPEESLFLRRTNKITDAGAVLRPAATWTLPNGYPVLVSQKTKKGYLLRFSDLLDVFIEQSGSNVVYSPRGRVPADSVRHLILDSVIALALSLRGHSVLHASAIVTEVGACAFAADSGVGKSTLAASFQKAGYLALTDDSLLLEPDGGEVYGVPSYPGSRLREDSLGQVGARRSATLSVAHYNSKRRSTAGPFATGRHQLSAVYYLERPRASEEKHLEPRIETLSVRDSLVKSLRYVFCLDPYDPVLLVRQFKTLEQLLSQVPVLRLTIPDDFSALPRVHAAVLSDLKTRSRPRDHALQ
jgi:hypothetical protein